MVLAAKRITLGEIVTKLEDTAASLDKPLLVAWAIGLGLQSLEQYVTIPDMLSVYANNCRDYVMPIIGAQCFGLKGLAIGAAAAVGMETANLAEHVTWLAQSSFGPTQLPAVGIGVVEAYFLERQRHRNDYHNKKSKPTGTLA